MGKSDLESQIREHPVWKQAIADSIQFKEKEYNFGRDENLIIRAIKAIGYYLNPLNYFK